MTLYDIIYKEENAENGNFIIKTKRIKIYPDEFLENNEDNIKYKILRNKIINNFNTKFYLNASDKI